MVFKWAWEGREEAGFSAASGFDEFTKLALFLDWCVRPSNDQVNLKLDIYNNFGDPENY